MTLCFSSTPKCLTQNKYPISICKVVQSNLSLKNLNKIRQLITGWQIYVEKRCLALTDINYDFKCLENNSLVWVLENIRI